MKSKLNMFQWTMLRWRELHPYSAVHVVLVERALDAARLKDAISQQLEALGLTNFELDRARGRYEWHGGREEADLKLLSGDDVPSLVDAEIARQLNVPFPPDGRTRPFRFFAVAKGDSFHFGLGYDHFVSGGDSIVRLLGAIVARYRGEQAATDAIDATAAPSYAGMFLRQIGPMLRGLGSLRAIASSLRRSFRPTFKAIEDGRNEFVRLRLGPPECAAMARSAEDWGVTQNDLFVTILLMALSPLAARRRQEADRCNLAIASIVNIRRDFGSEAQRAFTPLLASFHISEPVPDGISVKELAQSVHRESHRIRRGKLYLQTLLGLGLAAIQWRFLSLERRQGFFAKHHVVWAGTTPLNVAPLWAEGGSAGPAPEYLRGVSTGPSAPMICAISTVDEVVNVGMTYRTAAFDRNVVERVAADMISRIKSL